jgi:hypothetical protein
MTALVCAAVVATIVPAGPAHAGPVGEADVWTRLHRPLHSPPGQVRCPVSPPAALSEVPAILSTPGTKAFGDGPVYVQLSLSRGSWVLDMRRARARGGLRGRSSTLLVRAGYRGPLLIRAWRPDVSGKITMLGMADEQQAELRLPWGELRSRVAAGGWLRLPVTTWVSGPGCRVWQIDGLGFSQSIVAHVRF